jgi:hypothetical protein
MIGKLATLLLVLAGPAFGADSDAEVRQLRAELTVAQKYSDRKDAEIAALKKRVAELEQQLKGAAATPAANKAVPAASMPAATPAVKAAPVQPGQKCAGCRGVGTVPCQACWDSNRMSTGSMKCPTCGYRGKATCPSCQGHWGHTCKVCNGKGVYTRFWTTDGRIHSAEEICPDSRRWYNETTIGHCVQGTFYLCRKCVKGLITCSECQGNPRRDPCPACNGEKKVPCTQCQGKPAMPPATQPAGH